VNPTPTDGVDRRRAHPSRRRFFLVLAEFSEREAPARLRGGIVEGMAAGACGGKSSPGDLFLPDSHPITAAETCLEFDSRPPAAISEKHNRIDINWLRALHAVSVTINRGHSKINVARFVIIPSPELTEALHVV
jgi:hypothetical protein